MKTIKWLWIAALLAIGFKFYGLISSGPDGYGANEMEAFVGMVLTFALLSAVWLVLWAIGRAKQAVASRLADRG